MLQEFTANITRHVRPYILDASELLKKAKIDTKKIAPVDVGKLIYISNLENSFAPEANMKYWQYLVDKYEIPKYGPIDIIKDEAIKRYTILMSIGVFHYEFLIDNPEFTDDMIHLSAFEYASELLCPREVLLVLMKKMIPIKDIAEKLCAPEACVATMIKKILQE